MASRPHRGQQESEAMNAPDSPKVQDELLSAPSMIAKGAAPVLDDRYVHALRHWLLLPPLG